MLIALRSEMCGAETTPIFGKWIGLNDYTKISEISSYERIIK